MGKTRRLAIALLGAVCAVFCMAVMANRGIKAVEGENVYTQVLKTYEFDTMDANDRFMYTDIDGSGSHNSLVEPYLILNKPYTVKITPAPRRAAAFVWTAPQDGDMCAEDNGIQMIYTAGTSNADGGRWALVKAYKSGNETRLEPLYLDEGRTFWNDIGWDKTGNVTIKPTFGTRDNPLSVNKGDKIMFIIDAGENFNNDYDQIQCNKFYLIFKPVGVSNWQGDNSLTTWLNTSDDTTAYPSTDYTNLCAKAAEKNFSFVALDMTETGENALAEKSELSDFSEVKSYLEMQTPYTGQWMIESSGNWLIAATGSNEVRVMSKSNVLHGISYRAAESGTLKINSLSLKDISNVSHGFDYSIILKTSENGQDVYKFLYKPARLTDGDDARFNVARQGEVTLTRAEVPSVNLLAGDEVIFAVSSGGYANSNIAVNLEMIFSGENGADFITLNKTVALTKQGAYHNLYMVALHLKSARDYAAELTTVQGAEIRPVTGSAGIRFISELNEEAYNRLKDMTEGTDYLKQGENVTIEFGLIIAPKAYMDSGNANFKGELTEENLFGENAVYDWKLSENENYIPKEGKTRITKFSDSEMTAITSEGKTRYCIKGSIINIKESNYDLEFVAKGYIKISGRGETTYVLADGSGARSVCYVAKEALADPDKTWSEEEKAILNAFAGNPSGKSENDNVTE